MKEFLVFHGGVQGNENSNSPRWAHWSFFSLFFFQNPWKLTRMTSGRMMDY